jgi:hypothetical protein
MVNRVKKIKKRAPINIFGIDTSFNLKNLDKSLGLKGFNLNQGLGKKSDLNKGLGKKSDLRTGGFGFKSGGVGFGGTAFGGGFGGLGFGTPNRKITKGIPKREMNWQQAHKKYPKMSSLGDFDHDGVLNMFDCKPFNSRRQDEGSPELNTPADSNEPKVSQQRLSKRIKSIFFNKEPVQFTAPTTDSPEKKANRLNWLRRKEGVVTFNKEPSNSMSSNEIEDRKRENRLKFAQQEGTVMLQRPSSNSQRDWIADQQQQDENQRRNVLADKRYQKQDESMLGSPQERATALAKVKELKTYYSGVDSPYKGKSTPGRVGTQQEIKEFLTPKEKVKWGDVIKSKFGKRGRLLQEEKVTQDFTYGTPMTIKTDKEGNRVQAVDSKGVLKTDKQGNPEWEMERKKGAEAYGSEEDQKAYEKRTARWKENQAKAKGIKPMKLATLTRKDIERQKAYEMDLKRTEYENKKARYEGTVAGKIGLSLAGDKSTGKTGWISTLATKGGVTRRLYSDQVAPSVMEFNRKGQRAGTGRTIQGMSYGRRGRPAGTLDKRYAAYGGVYGFRKYQATQNAIARMQARRATSVSPQQQQYLNQVQQREQYARQDPERRVVPSTMGDVPMQGYMNEIGNAANAAENASGNSYVRKSLHSEADDYSNLVG